MKSKIIVEYASFLLENPLIDYENNPRSTSLFTNTLNDKKDKKLHFLEKSKFASKLSVSKVGDNSFPIYQVSYYNDNGDVCYELELETLSKNILEVADIQKLSSCNFNAIDIYTDIAFNTGYALASAATQSTSALNLWHKIIDKYPQNVAVYDTDYGIIRKLHKDVKNDDLLFVVVNGKKIKIYSSKQQYSDDNTEQYRLILLNR